ncbi:MAG TPA: hypothetical protein VKD90_10795 [Gemmataceae bacterium]|nr:hypothetical protein [Gemmataceae bacterium]
MAALIAWLDRRLLSAADLATIELVLALGWIDLSAHTPEKS